MSDQLLSHSEKQKFPTPKEAGISFVETVEKNRKYIQEQYRKGLVNIDQLEKFERFTRESLEKYKVDVNEAIKHFNEGRQDILRDTGIELSQEKAVSEMQLRLYKNHNIDRYTYKNHVFGQFRKGFIDGLVVGNYELVILLKEHGDEVLKNLFSWDTIKQIISSLGENFMNVFTGDAYMKGKSAIAVLLSTLGMAFFLNCITRGALKAGVSRATSGVSRRVADVYTIHTPKIDALDLTQGRSFPKPKTSQIPTIAKPETKKTSAVVSAWAASETSLAGEKIIPHSDFPENIHLPKTSYEIQGNTLLLRTFDDISETELETSLNALIREYDIATIHLDPHISHDAHRKVANILMRNHPLFEMMRLVNGNDVVNVTFGGIKDLNDIFGQKFVDDFVGGVVRKEIVARFDAHSSSLIAQWVPGHNRLVRNDYKNLTASFHEGTFSEQVLFGGEGDKKAFIDTLLRSHETMIQEVAREKGFSVDFVQQTIREKLDFWVGRSRVIDATPEGKMQAFYEAEIVSREGLKLPGIEAVSYDLGKIEACAKKVVQIEQEILHDFTGKYFAFRWVEYPVTLSIKGKQIINPHLLEHVRKHPEEFGADSEHLVTQTKELISSANRGFDFIAPVRHWSDDIVRAETMEKDFQQGVIRTESVQKTFKGVWTKEALIANVQGRKGMLVFLDVRGMGIDNIQAFVRLSRRVASGKYDKVDLMTGGESVTNKFITLVNHMKTKDISLGGDEGYFFFEWVGAEGADAIISDIHKALAESGLRWRVAYGFDTTDVAKTFKSLDSSTKVHKMFEETLDSLAVQKSMDPDVLPRTVHAKIPEGIQEELFIQWLKSSKVIKNQIEWLLKDISRGISSTQQQFPYIFEWRKYMTEIRYEWDFLDIAFTL